MNIARPMTAVAPRRRELRIIGAASGLGARDGRCAEGPAALRAHRPIDVLKAGGVAARWHETVVAGSAPTPVDAIADSCRRLADQVEGAVREGAAPAVVGGDHSCAIGTWRGVRRALSGDLGLVWIDAHMDAHTPETSPSGAVHGMPVACLLGRGDPRLAALAPGGPTIRAANLALVGVRSFEPDEASLLAGLGVKVFAIDEVRARGLGAVIAEAVDRVGRNAAGFGVTIDLDAIDPEDAPGTGMPVADGLRGRDVVAGLEWASRRPGYVGCEVAEFNPALDRDGRTVRLIVELLAAGAGAE